MKLSDRVNGLQPSATLAVSARAAELRRAGIEVLSFAAGEPDFDTPEPIKKAAADALAAGMTKYAPVPGTPDARRAIADKLARENNIPDVSPDHVVITAGGKQALFLLFQALLNEGDEVVIPTPAWVSYRPQAELAGGRVVEVPTTAAGGFRAPADAIAGAVTERTRVVILNSPSNPCGTMYRPDELRAIARALEPHDHVTIISDEIYEKLLIADVAHFSIGSVPEIAHRVVTVNGLAKAFSMTGWRIGYLAGSGERGLAIANACKKLQSQSTTCITSFCMPAIRVALEDCAEEVERMRQAFAARAKLIGGRLGQMPGVACPTPEGAFYAFPDFSACMGKTSAGGVCVEDSIAFATALLDEQHAACVPGLPFGAGGEACCRFSFACSEQQISAGMDKLEAFIAGLR